MMLKALTVLSTLLWSSYLFAGQVDNSLIVKKYHEQLSDVKQLVMEIQVTVNLSIPLAEAYSRFGLLPEISTHSQHFQQLQDENIKLLGKASEETPFPYCRELVYHADTLWLIRQNLARTNKLKSKELTKAETEYAHVRDECVKEIKNPPSQTKEETAIIDLTQ